jgi:ABC-2 type transport system permease protein
VFVPGLLVQLAFVTLFVGFGLIAELRQGVVERMRVTPMSRTAMLLGRSLRDVVILEAQGLIMIVVAIPFGLTVEASGVVLMLGLLGLIGLIMGPLSYALALATRSEDALAPLMNMIVFPIMLLSGIILPMSLAPDWLQTLASFNPFSHAVNAARNLFNGVGANGEVALGIGLMAVLAAAAVTVARQAFSRAAA